MQIKNLRNVKLKFWSQDDSPSILKSESQVSMGVNTKIFDGYGGISCEKVTKISARTPLHTLLGYSFLILSGAGLCAFLVQFKEPKNKSL